MPAVIPIVVSGFRAVLRAPWVLVGAYVLMALIAAGLSSGLQADLERRMGAVERTAPDEPPVVDLREWADGLHAAAGDRWGFSPRLLGFGGPLDVGSGLADGRARPQRVLVGVALFVAIWVPFWAGWLDRAAHGASGLSGALRAARRHGLAFAAVTLVALAGYLAIVAAAGMVLAPGAEPRADVLPGAVYAVMAAGLVGLDLLTDYTRVFLVLDDRGLVPAVGQASALLWARPRLVLGVLAASGAAAGGLLVAMMFADVTGAGVAGQARLLVTTQAYIVARLGVLLAYGAATVGLARRLET